MVSTGCAPWLTSETPSKVSLGVTCCYFYPSPQDARSCTIGTGLRGIPTDSVGVSLDAPDGRLQGLHDLSRVVEAPVRIAHDHPVEQLVDDEPGRIAPAARQVEFLIPVLLPREDPACQHPIEQLPQGVHIGGRPDLIYTPVFQLRGNEVDGPDGFVQEREPLTSRIDVAEAKITDHWRSVHME